MDGKRWKSRANSIGDAIVTYGAIAAATRNRIVTEETKQKMSVKRQGEYNPRFGLCGENSLVWWGYILF